MLLKLRKPALFVLFAGGLSFALLTHEYKRQLYEIANCYAIEQFGDHSPPLSKLEKKEWLSFMQIKNEEELTINCLRNYISSRERETKE